jgi:hypothetical protein
MLKTIRRCGKCGNEVPGGEETDAKYQNSDE